MAVAGAALYALLHHFLFGPRDEAEGRQDAAELQRAKVEGLKLGADVVDKHVAVQEGALDTRAAAEKKRSPVDVANEVIERKRES